MKILITNDDGIESPVLPALIRWARKLGDVTAIAPKYEQSGKSQSIDFFNEFEIKKVALAPDITAYSVDSTPADCVRFGVLGLGETYDLVISGINRGYNLGDDIVYSGTCGAIFEAARLHMKGVALSTDPDVLMEAPDRIDDVWAYVCDNRLLEQGDLFNINIPPEIVGTKITRQGGIFYTDAFEHRGGDMYIQIGEPVIHDSDDLSIDIIAIKNGYISVTPLTASRTDNAVFDKLKEL